MGNGLTDSSSEKETKAKKRVWIFLKRLVKEKPLGTIGLVITVILLLTGIFADLIAHYGMNETWVGDPLSPPSAQFWFGTDSVGRDVYSRVVYGARISVIVGLTGAAASTIVSTLIGVASGYFGGKLDLILQRTVDTVMCIPTLIILMVLSAIVGAGLWTVIAILGIFYGIPGSRIVRSAVISIKENMYVSAAESIGSSPSRLIFKHILPNIMPILILLFTVRVPAMVMTEATLSFLGFGIPPPTPSWGGMLSGIGRSYMFQAPWMALWPGLALCIVVYGVNMFGDAVRDLLDPRLIGGVGRYGGGGKKIAAIKREFSLKKDG
jgi:peptide/nickel transport system permease protein